MNRMNPEDVVGPLVTWTATLEQPVNNALFDAIEALMRVEFSYRAGDYASQEAYEMRKKCIRKEFNDRLLQLSGAK